MSLALAASFAVSPTAAATKKQTELTHVLGESRPECHRVALVNNPDSRHGFAKRAAQLRALSNQSAGPFLLGRNCSAAATVLRADRSPSDGVECGIGARLLESGDGQEFEGSHVILEDVGLWSHTGASLP